ncbi:hypothetical protein HDU76_013127 [Blyttiomyces sp. JEL0837]|nr:hypothetical protein HDU76_013127 [Blyttiomyces sp. JEL0837]
MLYATHIPDGVIPTGETLIKLGETVQIPPIGVGTWSWANPEWGFGENGFDEASVTEAFEAIQKSSPVSAFYDTAEMYAAGASEKLIGKLIASHPSESDRIITASKFIPLPWKISYPSSLLSALKDSLERCGLKSFELYQIHGPVHLRPIEVLADALAVAYKEGLVKAVGVSNYSIDEMKRMHAALAKHGIPLASNQVEFSLLRRHPETAGLIKAAHELGVVILAYSPLGMGKLTGKYSSSNPPPKSVQGRFGRVALDQLGPLLDTLNEVAKKYNKTASQVSLNWIICKGAVPIPGAKNAKQAEGNLGALGWRLSAEDVAKLDSVAFVGSTNMIWQHGSRIRKITCGGESEGCREVLFFVIILSYYRNTEHAVQKVSRGVVEVPSKH